MNTASTGYVIAFDFGLSQIGVALGHPLTGTARGLATLKAKAGKPDWRTVRALLAEYEPRRAVVGLPLNMDGSQSPMADRAECFAEQLSARIGLPAVLHDERLTTRSALKAFAEAKRLGIANSEHELAACIILESWFAEQK